jgi:hypothetical protein
MDSQRISFGSPFDGHVAAGPGRDEYGDAERDDVVPLAFSDLCERAFDAHADSISKHFGVWIEAAYFNPDPGNRRGISAKKSNVRDRGMRRRSRAI